MRNTIETRTNGYDLGHRQDRRFDAVRCAGNPRLAEVLSRGVKSKGILRESMSSQQDALALDDSQGFVQGKSEMGIGIMCQSILGQLFVGKRRLAMCPAVKRPVVMRPAAKRPVAERLGGTYRGTTMPWHLVCDRGEPARPVVHSTIRNT